MNRTSISWVLGPDGKPGYTWNPAAGCSSKPASKGCDHCWACRLAATRLAHRPNYKGLAYVDDSQDTDRERVVDRYRWSGETRFFSERLAEPLRRRAPAGIFVMDMGDIGLLPFEQLAAIFGVMAASPQHQYFVLSKHLSELRAWFDWIQAQTPDPWTHCHWEALETELHGSEGDGGPIHCKSGGDDARPWPLPNVRVGTSVCNRTDLRKVADLLQIPAALHFVSMEPLLEEIDLREVVMPDGDCLGVGLNNLGGVGCGIDLVIVGGESGPDARPCSIGWIRSIVKQCHAAEVACWVKQWGSFPVEYVVPPLGGKVPLVRVRLRDRVGSDLSELPADLRVRQMPEALR